jgi:hypothetical protein
VVDAGGDGWCLEHGAELGGLEAEVEPGVAALRARTGVVAADAAVRVHVTERRTVHVVSRNAEAGQLLARHEETTLHELMARDALRACAEQQRVPAEDLVLAPAVALVALIAVGDHVTGAQQVGHAVVVLRGRGLVLRPDVAGV